MKTIEGHPIFPHIRNTILLLCLFVCSCKTDVPLTMERGKKIGQLDLSNADAIFMAPDNYGVSTTSEKNKMPALKGAKAAENSFNLYKLTQDGEVDYTNYKEVIEADISPYYLSDYHYTTSILSIPNSPYLLFTYPGWYSYLVQTQTGAIYRLGDYDYFDHNFDVWLSSTVDNDGNIYFSNSKTMYAPSGETGDSNDNALITTSGIDMLSFTPSGQLSIETIGDYGKELIIDGEGNLWYISGTPYDDGKGSGRITIRKRNGQCAQTPCNYDCTSLFCGLDGKIHVWTVDHNTWTMDYILRCNLTDEMEIAFDTIKAIESSTDAEIDYFRSLYYRSSNHVIHIRDNKDSRCIDMIVLDSDDASEIYHSSTLKGSLIDIQTKDDFIYLGMYDENGETVIKRIDPHSIDESTVAFRDPEIEITSFIVQDDGTIQLSGNRLANGNSIIVSVDASGTMTILNEASTSYQIVLQRIN